LAERLTRAKAGGKQPFRSSGVAEAGVHRK
jgi:hypothetical protein